jgi:hypothetical protein
MAFLNKGWPDPKRKRVNEARRTVPERARTGDVGTRKEDKLFFPLQETFDWLGRTGSDKPLSKVSDCTKKIDLEYIGFSDCPKYGFVALVVKRLCPGLPVKLSKLLSEYPKRLRANAFGREQEF